MKQTGETELIMEKRITGWRYWIFGLWIEVENDTIPDRLHVQITEKDTAVAISIRYREKICHLTALFKSDNLAFLIDPILQDSNVSAWEVEVLFLLAFHLQK